LNRVIGATKIHVKNAVLVSFHTLTEAYVIKGLNFKNTTKNFLNGLHERAVLAAKTYKRSEVELIEILEEVDKNRVYYHQGFNSLFKYATDALKLSEEVAYIYINVCRKTREVPALKEELKNGAITVSKAKKLTSVLTPQNQNYWLSLAKSSSKRVLEKTVASVSPKTAVREKLTYVHPELEVKEQVKIINLSDVSDKALVGLCIPKEKARVQLQVGVSEALMIKLRRAQDILSQKRQSSVDLEQTLAAAIDLFLHKNDPVEKAKRQVIKGNLSHAIEVSKPEAETSGVVPGLVDAHAASEKSSARTPIPASTRHQLWIKHQGQCAHIDEVHGRCSQRRFLHVHHEQPVADGGTNDLINLSLLCAGHHRVEHFSD
jgi:hypothetical protein